MLLECSCITSMWMLCMIGDWRKWLDVRTVRQHSWLHILFATQQKVLGSLMSLRTIHISLSVPSRPLCGQLLLLFIECIVSMATEWRASKLLLVFDSLTRIDIEGYTLLVCFKTKFVMSIKFILILFVFLCELINCWKWNCCSCCAVYLLNAFELLSYIEFVTHIVLILLL